MQAGEACYMFTKSGCLMPGFFIGEIYSPDGLQFYEVRSTGGKHYTAQPANVFDEETGRAMLIERRAQHLVAEGYRLSLQTNGAFRIYNPDRHGLTGGYLLREIVPGHLNCTCPSYEKTGHCKHELAACSLLFARAHEADQQGKQGQAEFFRNIASRIAFGLTPEEKQQDREQFAALTQQAPDRSEIRAEFARKIARDF